MFNAHGPNGHGLALFDMQNDPFEKTNVIDKHPDIAKQLQEFADTHKEKFKIR